MPEMDATPLRDAYRAFLDAAAVVTGPGAERAAPPPGEWDADQILAHVSLVSADELGTLVPALLLSNGEVLVDQPLPLRDLLSGLAEVELPGHTAQLLALLPDGTRTRAAR